MKIFVFVMIVMAVISVMTCIGVRNRKYAELADEKTRFIPWLLMVTAMVVCLDMAAYPSLCRCLIADMSLPLLSMFLLSSSMYDFSGKTRLVVFVLLAVELCLAVHYLLCLTGLAGRLSSRAFSMYSTLTLMSLPVIFMIGMFTRLKAVKEVLKSGNVWDNLRLGVDAVYVILPLSAVVMTLYFEAMYHEYAEWSAALASILICGGMLATAIRLSTDSLFIFWRTQERRIVESMQVTNVVSSSGVSHMDEVYKDVYERIVAYFDRDRPYLDSELTISDLVKVIYSNKLYISKAISHYTGKNFRQFVNNHRVKYSMDCFRENPDLKVHELGAMSGFNSIVSYNMAFRLVMGENPSDWCRKEKGRMVKTKK